MSKIEEFFERGVEAGYTPQIPMNYDTVAYKIYTSYLENKTDELTAENAELRERLEKATELPCVKLVNPKVRINRIGIVNVIREWAVVYIDRQGVFVVEHCKSKTAAEARLEELKGGME